MRSPCRSRGIPPVHLVVHDRDRVARVDGDGAHGPDRDALRADQRLFLLRQIDRVRKDERDVRGNLRLPYVFPVLAEEDEGSPDSVEDFGETAARGEHAWGCLPLHAGSVDEGLADEPRVRTEVRAEGLQAGAPKANRSRRVRRGPEGPGGPPSPPP